MTGLLVFEVQKSHEKILITSVMFALELLIWKAENINTIRHHLHLITWNKYRFASDRRAARSLESRQTRDCIMCHFQTRWRLWQVHPLLQRHNQIIKILLDARLTHPHWQCRALSDGTRRRIYSHQISSCVLWSLGHRFCSQDSITYG